MFSWTDKQFVYVLNIGGWNPKCIMLSKVCGVKLAPSDHLKQLQSVYCCNAVCNTYRQKYVKLVWKGAIQVSIRLFSHPNYPVCLIHHNSDIDIRLIIGHSTRIWPFEQNFQWLFVCVCTYLNKDQFGWQFHRFGYIFMLNFKY